MQALTLRRISPGNTRPWTSLRNPTRRRGRPPEYCEGRGCTKVTAWRERRRLAGATTSPADTGSPVTMAKATGAELLCALRADADRAAGTVDWLRQAVETLTDPTAAEAEVEAIRAAAKQSAAAEARAASAEQRAAEADQWRADAEAAAEEMARTDGRRPGPRRRRGRLGRCHRAGPRRG